MYKYWILISKENAEELKKRGTPEFFRYHLDYYKKYDKLENNQPIIY